MFEIHSEEKNLHIVMSASLDNIDSVCIEIKNFLGKHQLEKLIFDIQLGVREVINNAVVHGSKNQTKYKVDVNVFFNNNQLGIKVIDQGRGFNHKSLGTCAELSGHGRGMKILKMYFDTVSYNDKGNVVLLIRNI